MTETAAQLYSDAMPEPAGRTAGAMHLSSRQMQQFATSVKAGNLYEIKQFFTKFNQVVQRRPEALHVPVQQLAAGLMHLLSEEGREQTAQFQECLRLLSLPVLTGGSDLLLEKTYEAARQTALLLGESQPEQNVGGSLLDNIVQHVSRGYADETLSLASTARELGFSAGYLGDYFKRTAGINFTDYLISVRLEKAKALLQTTASKAYEIAFACGFSNPHYFSVVFKKYVGITPSQFREQAAIRVQEL